MLSSTYNWSPVVIVLLSLGNLIAMIGFDNTHYYNQTMSRKFPSNRIVPIDSPRLCLQMQMYCQGMHVLKFLHLETQ